MIIKRSRVKKVRAWLKHCGATILNNRRGELLRANTKFGEFAIKTRSIQTCEIITPQTEKVWFLYRSGKCEPLYPGDTGDKQITSGLLINLLKRDGEDCFYCGQKLGCDITKEHLVPLSKDGPNNSSNIVLAHKKCNSKAGNLSLSEKIALRDKMRGFK